MATADIPFQYLSIKQRTEGIYKEKGSKFFAYAIPVGSVDDAMNFLDEIRDAHPKSRHVCYAYRIGIRGEPYRFNDDGEPSGTAGRPIYNELLSHKYSDILCAVVRYFGGTKLGVPGLIRAYKESTQDALLKAEEITISLTKKVKIEYHMEDMGRLYDILKTRGYNDIQSVFVPKPHLIIDVSLKDLGLIRQVLLADYHGYGVNDISPDFTSDRLKVTIDD